MTLTISPGTVDRVRHQQGHGPDEVLVDQPTRFGTVFALSSPRQPMLGPGSLGHDGPGGHLAFAHPESGMAFAYLTNRAVPAPMPHTRLWRLLSAGATRPVISAVLAGSHVAGGTALSSWRVACAPADTEPAAPRRSFR